MFDAAECVFLYLEAGLHVGSGEEGLVADLPIQREPATGYPVVPASSLKGTLRDRARLQRATPELLALLGSAPESDDRQPSWIVLSDALPLLFPVRSLRGLFVWITSADIWARFQRDVTAYGVKGLPVPPLPALPPETAGVAPAAPFLTSKQTLVLEEMSFPVQAAPEMADLGAWLAEHAFPDDPAFAYWRQRAAQGIALLPEGAYRYFVEHGTHVVPRIRIDPQTGTAAHGALWTEELVPPESLFYALVGVQAPQQKDGSRETEIAGGQLKAPAAALDWVKGLAPSYLQVGAGKTLGRGLVRLRWTGKKVVRARGKKTTKKS